MKEAENIKDVTFEHLVAGWAFIVGDYKVLAPVVECADGTCLSVQASKFHGCLPKDDFGPYQAVEVYLLTEECIIPAEWTLYQSQWDANLFGWIPVEAVRAFIASHGGQV